ncbi:MAG: hypothetical protein PHO23_03010 [Candidatus Pacebacteria bacterium]|nr:hypothetical protein [Candidatus Paceibacterota bacterium]
MPVKFEYKDKTASVSLEKYVPVVQLKNVRGGILNVTTKVFKGGPGFTFG